jgi:hypothetical protein
VVEGFGCGGREVKSEEKGEDDKSRSSLMEVRRLNGAVFPETMPLTRSSNKLFGFYAIGWEKTKESALARSDKTKPIKSKIFSLNHFLSSFDF